jgi:hypothetical protein
MQANDAAEQLVDLNAVDGTQVSDADRLRTAATILIAVIALLRAITSLGGGNAGDDKMNNNIHASDTDAFDQAKTSARQRSPSQPTM